MEIIHVKYTYLSIIITLNFLIRNEQQKHSHQVNELYINKSGTLPLGLTYCILIELKCTLIFQQQFLSKYLVSYFVN